MKARDMDAATLIALADELEKDARAARALLRAKRAASVVMSWEESAVERMALALEAHAKRFRNRAEIARKARVSS